MRVSQVDCARDAAKYVEIVRSCMANSGVLNSGEWMKGYDAVFRQVRAQQEEHMYKLLARELHDKAASICETLLGAHGPSDIMERYCSCLTEFAASVATLHRISAHLHRLWIPKQPIFDPACIDARAAALSILLIWHFRPSELSVLPLEIVTMIARLVYQSRTEVEVWTTREGDAVWRKSDELDERVCTAYELGIRTWNRLVLDKVFDLVAPGGSREKMRAHVTAEFRKGIDLLYGAGRAPKKLTLE